MGGGCNGNTDVTGGTGGTGTKAAQGGNAGTRGTGGGGAVGHIAIHSHAYTPAPGSVVSPAASSETF
jgi:hypothetical protein